MNEGQDPRVAAVLEELPATIHSRPYVARAILAAVDATASPPADEDEWQYTTEKVNPGSVPYFLNAEERAAIAAMRGEGNDER